VNLSQEAALTLQQSVDANTSLLELQQKRAELVQRFTPAYPGVAAVDKQIAEVKDQLSSLSAHVDGLPDLEQTAIRLLRDVTVNNDLYTSLLNNAQQLRVLKAGKVGNVRVVDSAPEPEEPVKPKKALVIALGVVFGLLLGTAAAFFRKTVLGGVEDGFVIERATNLSLYATVPFSANQKELDNNVLEQSEIKVLAERYPEDITIESIRSLRTSLQFAMLDATNNVIMITSPCPASGKTFISTNLAAILANGGKRVLLIDGDMRRGHTHESFGLKRDLGLSNLIVGSHSIDLVVHKNVIEGLDFISTGPLPPRPAELLLNKKFKEILEDLSSRYEIILIDAPPVLAVTDAALIGAYSGTTLLSLRYGLHPLGEITETARRLTQAGVTLRGALLNGVPRHSAKYGRYLARYYNYGYARAEN
jgi:tyrosine-protein kinase Etk/Wzc